jgi:hypothetical protein
MWNVESNISRAANMVHPTKSLVRLGGDAGRWQVARGWKWEGSRWRREAEGNGVVAVAGESSKGDLT